MEDIAVKCYQIIVYNDSLTITKFALRNFSNTTIIYVSGNYKKGETWILDLNTLSIKSNTQYFIKALVVGADSLSDKIVQYDPTSTATAYFELTGDAFETSLKFLTIVEDNQSTNAIEKNKNLLLKNYKDLLVSYENSRQLYEEIIYEIDKESTTPVLKFSSISARNYTWTVANWQLLTTTGENVYISGNQRLNNIFSLDLSQLQILDGTQLRLKALVRGDDSMAELILDYQPRSNVTAYFQLNGSAFKTNVIYLGTSNPW